jgi:hypothetical protein
MVDIMICRIPQSGYFVKKSRGGRCFRFGREYLRDYPPPLNPRRSGITWTVKVVFRHKEQLSNLTQGPRFHRTSKISKGPLPSHPMCNQGIMIAGKGVHRSCSFFLGPPFYPLRLQKYLSIGLQSPRSFPFHIKLIVWFGGFSNPWTSSRRLSSTRKSSGCQALTLNIMLNIKSCSQIIDFYTGNMCGPIL